MAELLENSICSMSSAVSKSCPVNDHTVNNENSVNHSSTCE